MLDFRITAGVMQVQNGLQFEALSQIGLLLLLLLVVVVQYQE